MATSIATCSAITSLHKNAFDPLSTSSSSISTVSLPKLTSVDRCFSTANQRYLTSGSQISRRHTKSKKEFIVYAGDQIGDLLPFGIHLPDSWEAYVPGFVLAVIVPFFTNKWGPFSKFKAELDKVEEAVDGVADRVEEMAEKVEQFVDEIGDELPEGKLKAAFEKVENVADKIGDNARMVSDIVDKMDEMEAKVENIFNSNSNTSQGNTTPKTNAVSADVKKQSTNL